MNKNFTIAHEETKISESLGISSEREEALDNLLESLINPEGSCDQDCENCNRHIMSHSLDKMWDFAETNNELTYLLFLFGCATGQMKAEREMGNPLEALMGILGGERKTPGGIIVPRESIGGMVIVDKTKKPKAQA